MQLDPYRSVRDKGYIRECTDMAGNPGFALFDCDGVILLVSPRKSDLFFEAAKQDVRVVLPN